ncbi:DUF4279 domain-containing protein [Burkholderia sp. AU45251]|uniref:DUF4279 domain-containing protein n=1 Tax=Burkholderia sp. AU45251 TaxID=3059204 RepID=UPI002650442C|nr:DUF4279 domain-containing protein [Burkholderia sp. AU45251]MDN7519900.1 DUF4279 domain-containing protein [Burkholderia sp. AU45251]
MFIISSEDAHSDTWTAFFGIFPSRTVTKGKPYLLPCGRLSSRPGRLNLRALESRAAVQSDRLEPHLRYLIERLSLPREGLLERIERAGARMRFFCYWDNENGDRVPHVSDATRKIIESVGAVIEIDEYR